MKRNIVIEKQLRDYQNAFVKFMLRHVHDGAKELLLCSPTGSGKTLTTQALVEHLLATAGFSKCLVITPQIQIEAGFVPAKYTDKDGNKCIENVKISTFKGQVRVTPEKWVKNREHQGNIKSFLAAVSPATRVIVTTHAAVTREIKNDDNFFPKGDTSLASAILIVDEAHRAGTDNQLGKDFVPAWKSHAGVVIYLTATPFRTSEDAIIPDGIPRLVRTVAEHMNGVDAPSKMSINAIPLGLTASTEDQVKGDCQGDGDDASVEISVKAIIDQLEKDHWPKSVIIVPSKKSERWATALEAAIRQTGHRVENIVGVQTGKEDKKLTDLFTHERQVTKYADSKVDVFLACKRFDEGTDWPLCSHVYNVGFPGRAFNLILQRWGRSMRNKSGIEGYPEEHAQTAAIMFLILTMTDELWATYGKTHIDYVFLLSCYQANFETAQEYQACIKNFVGGGGRRGGSDGDDFGPPPNDDDYDVPTEDLIEDIVAELQGINGDLSTARAVRTAVSIEQALRTGGNNKPTLKDVLVYAEETLKLDAEEVREVKDCWGAKILMGDKGAEAFKSLMKKLAKEARTRGGTSVPTNIITKELREHFDECIDTYSDKVFVDEASRVVDLSAALSSQSCSDVSKFLGDRLGTRGRELTLEEIKAGILKYYEEHGKCPSHAAGDAAKYFRINTSWDSVHMWLRSHHKSTLSQICYSLGLRQVLPQVDDSALKRAINLYHSKHGRCPSTRKNSENASEYVGFDITWESLAGRFHKETGKTVPQICAEMGLRDGRLKTESVMDASKKAIQMYYDKYGECPSQLTKTKVCYFGLPSSWASLDGRLFRLGTSISKLCVALCLKSGPLVISKVQTNSAVLSYYSKHGKCPVQRSGDASPYFGFEVNWANVDQVLRGRLCTSLSKLCAEMKAEGLLPS